MIVKEKHIPAPTEKLTTSLPLMESFLTIQGEGHHQGKAAYFVRLGGCDVGCVWCDVKESWDASAHPLVSVKDMADEAARQCPMVVVTGGEPLMYNLDHFTQSLKDRGLKTHVETSGTHPLSGQWDWLCFSPKKFKKPLEEFYDKADELKIIVYNRSDLAWAETHAQKVNDRCQLFLQPEWSVREKVTPWIIDYVKANPQWQISLQVHKYLDIP